MKYKEQLKQPEWHKKAALIKLRDLNCCTKCGSYSNIHVHHTYYEQNKMAWEYPDESLITVCKECHNILHKSKIPYKKIKKSKEDLLLLKQKRKEKQLRQDLFLQELGQKGLEIYKSKKYPEAIIE